MSRKFFKTTIVVTVLSEDEPVSADMPLEGIGYEIVHGDWSGEYDVTEIVELSGKEAADALAAQGSDPSFFRLNEDGSSHDTDDDDPLAGLLGIHRDNPASCKAHGDHHRFVDGDGYCNACGHQ